MREISLIGLGTMGTELARVLIEKGWDVTVWNRTPEKAARHVEAGARLAASAAEAVRASPVTITCVKTHSDTRKLLSEDPSALAGKTVIELSTGSAAEAEQLLTWLTEQGAECLIGMIATFPSGIGKADSAIVAIGSRDVWQKCETILKTLAGGSSYLGTNPKALAALYAALFLPRQGFMFGMIYGALLCEKAGISMQSYAEQIPLTIKVVDDYYDLFAQTMTSGDFSNPPASLGTYHAAFQDILDTCRDLEVAEELPKLLLSLLQKGMDAGLHDQQITALVRLLAKR